MITQQEMAGLGFKPRSVWCHIPHSHCLAPSPRKLETEFFPLKPTWRESGHLCLCGGSSPSQGPSAAHTLGGEAASLPGSSAHCPPSGRAELCEIWTPTQGPSLVMQGCPQLGRDLGPCSTTFLGPVIATPLKRGPSPLSTPLRDPALGCSRLTAHRVLFWATAAGAPGLGQGRPENTPLSMVLCPFIRSLLKNWTVSKANLAPCPSRFSERGVPWDGAGPLTTAPHFQSLDAH